MRVEISTQLGWSTSEFVNFGGTLLSDCIGGNQVQLTNENECSVSIFAPFVTSNIFSP